MEIENHKMEIENHKMEIENHNDDIENHNDDIENHNDDIENHNDDIYIYITNYKTNYKTMGGLRTLAFLERGVASLVKQPPNPQRGNTSIFFTSISPNPQRGLNLQYLTGDSRSESSRVCYYNNLSAKPIPVLFI